MSYVLGLTGSIGMGKSTTAAMLGEMGLAIWDADAAVHQLYAKGGAAAPQIAALCPSCVHDGAVDRAALRQMVQENPDLLDKITQIVHPLVAADRSAFIAAAKGDIVVLDIPLLFEIGADNLCNGVIVVTAPPEVQKARVLARGLSEDAFNALLARQMPDKEKQRRATWVVQTTTLEDVRRALQDIVLQIKKGISHA